MAAAKKPQIRATTTWHLQTKKPVVKSLSTAIDAVVYEVSKDDLGPMDLYEPRGEDWDRGPIPDHPLWTENMFILGWAAIPLTLQALFLRYSGYNIPALDLAFPPTDYIGLIISIVALIIQYAVYQATFIVFAEAVLRRCQYFMQKYGTLNEEKRGRDLIPDVHHRRVMLSLVLFSFVRGLGGFLLAFNDRTSMPHFSLWTPVKIGLFLIALDYFFYVYHRTTHEVDALWWVHSQHHATKSPTPSMSLWADPWQDLLEWVLVPACAFAIVRLNFSELWVASLYLMYVEAVGHSGIRANFTHPLLTPVLKPFHVELAIEDHDLHHRYGRGGKNYGKQTRIWDTLFGTVAPREEQANYEAKHGRK